LINFYSCGGKKYLITDKLNKPKLNEMKPLATNDEAMPSAGFREINYQITENER
jgi:hypothetical protein